MRYVEIVQMYFEAWKSKDASGLPTVFSDEIIYTECYGPQYRGLSRIQRWFADWNLRGTVLRWDIKNTLESGNSLCVEWYFQCEYDGVVDGFDGVSWIEFDEQGKIKACASSSPKLSIIFHTHRHNTNTYSRRIQTQKRGTQWRRSY